jgi:hypothetical protein
LLPQTYDAAGAEARAILTNMKRLWRRAVFRCGCLPENPSLLILMANIEAPKELNDLAIIDASAALEYLE